MNSLHIIICLVGLFVFVIGVALGVPLTERRGYEKKYKNQFSDESFVAAFQARYAEFEAADIILARQEVAAYTNMPLLCMAIDWRLPNNHVGIGDLFDDLFDSAEAQGLHTLASFSQLPIKTAGDVIYLYLKFILVPDNRET